MKKTNDCIIFDGDLISADTAVAPADSRGLMYGDGIFDTLRIYSGQSFLLAEHLKRTLEGLEYLGIEAPENFTETGLKADIKQLLLKNDLNNKDAIVRIQLWREGGRGYTPPSDSGTHYTVTASQCPITFDEPTLVTVDQKRIPSESLPSKYKLTNGINYILAAREARQKGGDDALMLTTDGWISETTIANLFWRKGTEIFTPSEECDLLPGLTRGLIIDLIEQHDDLQVTEGRFSLDHLLQFDAVWISNSVRELLPVKAVDGEVMESRDPVFSEIKQRFESHRDAHLKPL